MVLKCLLFFLLCFKHFSNGRLYEPRLDELIQRTTVLQNSMNTVKTVLKNTEKLLEEEKARSESKGSTNHISVGFGGKIYSPAVEIILQAGKSTCTWELHALQGHFINLNFSYFNLTYGEASSKHVFNKLRILTRISEGELIEEAVLWQNSRPVRSHGNTMVLQYEANQLFNGIGFTAEYKSECRTSLTAERYEKKLFSHPLYGYENYSPNVDCEWSLKPQPLANLVILTLQEFHVGTKNLSDQLDSTDDKALQEGFQESYCQNDFVEIYTHSISNGVNDPNPFLLGRICGDSVPRNLMEILAPKIIVKFHSVGGDGEAPGFSATYRSM